jgi:NADP-dependent 3-hydroxy acid dehydrogenase YdfG
MIAVTGYRTTIVQELRAMTDQHVVRMDMELGRFSCKIEVPKGVERFVLAAGVLHSERAINLRSHQIYECVAVNMTNVIRICETILDTVEHARICVIGSESGFKGSYNELYAATKAAIHAYVSWTHVSPTQSLRRKDYPDGLVGRETVSAQEVATRVLNALFNGEYLGKTNVERMTCN